MNKRGETERQERRGKQAAILLNETLKLFKLSDHIK